MVEIRIAGPIGERFGIEFMTLANPHPALFGEHHSDGLAADEIFRCEALGFGRLLEWRPADIAVFLGIGSDLAFEQRFEASR